jgi:hypothetical protein
MRLDLIILDTNLFYSSHSSQQTAEPDDQPHFVQDGGTVLDGAGDEERQAARLPTLLSAQ